MSILDDFDETKSKGMEEKIQDNETQSTNVSSSSHVSEILKNDFVELAIIPESKVKPPFPTKDKEKAKVEECSVKGDA